MEYQADFEYWFLNKFGGDNYRLRKLNSGHYSLGATNDLYEAFMGGHKANSGL